MRIPQGIRSREYRSRPKQCWINEKAVIMASAGIQPLCSTPAGVDAAAAHLALAITAHLGRRLQSLC
jgi:hypothetical protein